MKEKLRRLLAYTCSRVPLAEKMLQRACAADLPGARSTATAYVQVLPAVTVRRAILNGYTLRVNVAEWRGVTTYFLGDSHTLWFVPELVRPGDVCLDIGANMGHYTILLAYRVGTAGRVVACEPQPPFADLIARSASENGYDEVVDVERRAVCDVSGETLTLHLGTSDNSGLASLYEEFYRGCFKGEKRGEGAIQVESVTLEDVFEEKGIDHARFVKVDVEGAEHRVVDGACRLLVDRRIDYLLVETVAEGRADRRLTDLGYTGYYVDTKNRLLVDASRGEKDRVEDYLFVSPELPEDHVPVVA